MCITLYGTLIASICVNLLLCRCWQIELRSVVMCTTLKHVLITNVSYVLLALLVLADRVEGILERREHYPSC